jgi:hypothetical protein
MLGIKIIFCSNTENKSIEAINEKRDSNLSQNIEQQIESMPENIETILDSLNELDK